MSRATALLTVLALAVPSLLTGCASSTAAKGPSIDSPSFGQDATGVVNFWDRNTTSPFGSLLVKEFNATHPHLKVELTPIQDGQYVTKLATAIRSGTAPDLVGVDDINSQLFIDHNAFMDLTPVVDRLPYKDQLSPGALNLTTDNGHYYGTPYVADLSMLWYNKTLFRRAGLDPNAPPRTFAQLLADARAITALGHGVYGFSFAGDCEGCLGFTALPNVWATGEHILNGPPSHQTANIAHNTPLERTLELYRELWADHLSSPASLTQNGATWGQDFLAGDIGLFPGGYGTVSEYAKPSQLRDFGIAPLPGPDGGTATFDGGANFGIPKGAKNASGAWEFIRFALAKQQQAQAASVGFSPIRSDVDTPSYRAKYPLDAVALGALRDGYAPKTLAYNVTFNQPGGPWLTMFTRAVFGGDVPGALRAGQAGFTDALDEAES